MADDMGREIIERARPRQFCTFELAGRLYGVDILDVKEISPQTCFTPIFHAPAVVKGYVNIRGMIHLVVNLRGLLGLEDVPKTGQTKLVIFKPTVGEAFGVLVDRIGDVVEVMEDEIEDRRQADKGPPESGEQRGEGRNLVIGVSKLEKQLLIVLNARFFLDAINIKGR
jgi:purine-binding chemotaxis protein CheW